MTRPADGYPPLEPGGPHPPPADSFPTPPGEGPHRAPYGPPGQPPHYRAGLRPEPSEPDPFGAPTTPPTGSYPAGPPGPPYGPPAGPPGMSPDRRRGLLILAAAVAGVLVLCGGGGVGAWLLTRDTDRDGAASPVAAVQSFLQAVYRDHDPAQAAALVCTEARDREAMQSKIDEISAYQDTQVDPSFRWNDPEVLEQTDELAIVTVTITMITGDEKIADQTLRVSVLDKDPHGWWVCNMETVEPSDEDEDTEPEDDDDETGEDDE